MVMSRRALMARGGAVAAGLSFIRVAGPARAFQSDTAGEVIPWIDQLEPNPVPEVIVQQLTWEELDTWVTPNSDFFVIKHYNQPTLDEATWALEIDGLVDNPLKLTLEDVKARA